MRLFKCQSCGQILFFENNICGRCGHALGYLADTNELSALEIDGDAYRPLADPAQRWWSCGNAAHGVCNWLIPAGSSERFCLACRHNRIVPDLSVTGNLAAWAKLEQAKHRLFYTLLRLGLPRPNRIDDPRAGLAFDFLSDMTGPSGQKVMTGHEDGLITLAVTEADDAERERRRAQMGEPYRTLLGHFRHEVGHFYWDLLIRGGGRLDSYRALFGDERRDYGAALQQHYVSGPPGDWQERYVSAYATSHPWEDWAETWAHYLHIMDGTETAGALGLTLQPDIDDSGVLHTARWRDPYVEPHFDRLASIWLPLTVGLNAMNQSMGQSDLYPFVISPTVVTKLGFIHDVVRSSRVGSGAATAPTR